MALGVQGTAVQPVPGPLTPAIARGRRAVCSATFTHIATAQRAPRLSELGLSGPSPLHLLGAREKVLLADLVVLEVEVDKLIHLASEGLELRRVGRQRLHEATDRPDVRLHE